MRSTILKSAGIGLIWVCALCAGAPTPMLFQVSQQEALFARLRAGGQGDAASPTLPHRVYLVYDAPNKMWSFELSDGAGTLPEPPEFLRGHSVLPGDWVGGKADERYELAADSRWRPTGDARREFYWVPPTPFVSYPRVKIVTYEASP